MGQYKRPAAVGAVLTGALLRERWAPWPQSRGYLRSILNSGVMGERSSAATSSYSRSRASLSPLSRWERDPWGTGRQAAYPSASHQPPSPVQHPSQVSPEATVLRQPRQPTIVPVTRLMKSRQSELTGADQQSLFPIRASLPLLAYQVLGGLQILADKKGNSERGDPAPSLSLLATGTGHLSSRQPQSPCLQRGCTDSALFAWTVDAAHMQHRCVGS